MSQNRQAEKDRLRAEANFQLNLKNEVTLQRLSKRVDQLAELVARQAPR